MNIKAGYKGLLAAVICSLLVFSSCAGSGSDNSANDTAGASVTSTYDNTESLQELSELPEEESKQKEYTYVNTDFVPGDYKEESKKKELSDLEETSEKPETSKLEVTPDDQIFSSPICKSSLLYCIDDEKVLYNDSASLVTAPASLTKLLTASVVYKYMNPEDEVTVGDEQYFVNADSSKCFISIGNVLTVEDLMTGMLLCSGNDAAYTAAVSTARALHKNEELSDEQALAIFGELMNDFAAGIGMKSSHFVNPDGWDDEQQYVTGEDMLKLSVYALSVPEIRTIVGTKEKTVEFKPGETMTWYNTNGLLYPGDAYYCENAIGMKTGTTDNAGCCLVSAFEKNNKTYVTVVLGCGSDNDRYELTLKLFDLIDNPLGQNQEQNADNTDNTDNTGNADNGENSNSEEQMNEE